ncbi:MAG: type II toxin-antitoxin system RelE/ParE family toxin [Firmicutes bacterium]|nr:type II toxin-antitoxin system RelE/ParE family toxin [Bacillota bacterium]
MKREFIRTIPFERSWAAAGLNDGDLRELENVLLENPDAGMVIPGLSGCRKLRFQLPGRGKSGGARVVYVDIVVREKIFLLLAYPKNVQENLTSEQRRSLSCLVDILKKEA